MYITVISPALWPFDGHTNGPHHITAAERNSQSLGKRGKKDRGGWVRKKSREGGENLSWVEGLQKQSQNLKTKFTTERKQRG